MDFTDTLSQGFLIDTNSHPVFTSIISLSDFQDYKINLMRCKHYLKGK